jgi:5,10-methylenetetrahydromethanopterin reductase
VKEAIEIIYAMLSETSAKYEGEVFRAKTGARFRWNYSVAKPPEIWIGSWGPKMAKLAGRMKQVSGIMVSSITDGSYLAHIRELVRVGASAVSRDADEIEIGCVPGTIVSRDRDLARELARKASAVYLPYLEPMTEYVGVKREEIEAVKKELLQNNLQAAASKVPDRAVDAFKLWGTPDDIVEKTLRMLDSGRGADRINFGFGRGEEDLGSIKLLGDEVLPQLRKNFAG